MGQVHKAMDDSLERPVALEILPQKISGTAAAVHTVLRSGSGPGVAA
ncbi:MAG: hypothetical protein WBX15_21080 [Thermoanaerobaculia bacterium]